MSKVDVKPEAQRDLLRLIRTRSLPASTATRVAARLGRLGDHPLVGGRLAGRYAAWRFIPGPWPWMLIIYRYDEPADTVVVVSIQDARTSTAWSSGL